MKEFKLVVGRARCWDFDGTYVRRLYTTRDGDGDKIWAVCSQDKYKVLKYIERLSLINDWKHEMRVFIFQNNDDTLKFRILQVTKDNPDANLRGSLLDLVTSSVNRLIYSRAPKD